MTIRETIAEQSLQSFGSERLSLLLRAVGAESDSDELIRIFRRMLEPWGHREVGDRPRFPSNIADDRAPFEFSLGVSDGPPEVQVYVDPQLDPAAPRSNMLESRALLESLAREHGLPLRRLALLEDILLPDEPLSDFTLWIGASWAARRGVRFKIYLNPQVRGSKLAPELVAEALARLGLGAQWQAVRSVLTQGQGLRNDELSILSLDLSDSREARVKLYVRHHGATLDEIHAIASVARDHVEGDGRRFYRALGVGSGPFRERPPQTEFSFVDADETTPAAVTWEFPVGTHSKSNGDAHRRIERCLQSFGLATSDYDRGARAFAVGALEEGHGLHAHVTLRRIHGRPRIATYFASEAYGTDPGLRARPASSVSTASAFMEEAP